MPRFSSKRRVHHTASQMFDLVADVERYPEFVPLCQSLRIRQRTPKADGTEVIVADMTVSFKLVRESFTSRVTLDRPNLKIMVEYLKGPFSNLENRWTFEPKSETDCDVGFFLSYEFRSRMLAMLMGTMFDTAFQRFAAAFEKRADAVYGKGGRLARLVDQPEVLRALDIGEVGAVGQPLRGVVIVLAGLFARRGGIAALDGLDQARLLLDRDRGEFGCLGVLDGDRVKFFGNLAVDHHDEIERVLVVSHLGDDVDQLTLGLEMTLGAVLAIADRLPHLLENGLHAGDVAVGARQRRIRRGLDDDAIAQAQQFQQLLALLEAGRADPKSRAFLRLGDEGPDADAALDDAVVFELRDRLSHHRPRHAEFGRQRLFGRQAIARPKLARM